VHEEVEVLLGEGLGVLTRLGREVGRGRREGFDFVFVDAEWKISGAIWRGGVRLCKGRGSVVYVDNVVRLMMESGVVGPEERDPRVEDLVEMVGRDEGVDAFVM